MYNNEDDLIFPSSLTASCSILVIALVCALIVFNTGCWYYGTKINEKKLDEKLTNLAHNINSVSCA